MRQQGFEKNKRGEEPWKLKPAAAGCGREWEIATTAFHKTRGRVGRVCTVRGKVFTRVMGTRTQQGAVGNTARRMLRQGGSNPKGQCRGGQRSTYLFFTIYRYLLQYAAINCYLLLSTINCYCLLLSTTIYYYLRLFTIYYCALLASTVYYYLPQKMPI